MAQLRDYALKIQDIAKEIETSNQGKSRLIIHMLIECKDQNFSDIEKERSTLSKVHILPPINDLRPSDDELKLWLDRQDIEYKSEDLEALHECKDYSALVEEMMKRFQTWLSA